MVSDQNVLHELDRRVIARKTHYCWSCGKQINTGEPYWWTHYQGNPLLSLRETCKKCTRKEAAAGNGPR